MSDIAINALSSDYTKDADALIPEARALAEVCSALESSWVSVLTSDYLIHRQGSTMRL